MFVRLMRKAMREPLFLEFVDECLNVVKPSQQELTDQQVTIQLNDSGQGKKTKFPVSSNFHIRGLF